LSAACWRSSIRAQTPIYQATATVLINQSQAVTGPTYSDVLANQQLTQTYGRLITSGPVLEQAGASFDLSFDEMRETVSVSTSDEPQLIDITARNEDRTWRRGSPTKPPAFSPSRSRQRRPASRRRSRTPTSSVRS
jgi:capsular polysaccharide biosynthesis protein